MSSSDRLPSTRGRVEVVGLGYIGLPTAVVFAHHGWHVTGVDVNPHTVQEVNEGRLPFVEEGLESVLREVAGTTLTASTEPVGADVVIVSVPTPFGEDHVADLRFIDAAADSIVPVLRGGELVVLESTVPPGATEHMARRILSARPDLAAEDGVLEHAKVDFAHAPERVLPGRIMAELTTNDRIMGGIGQAAAQRAKDVYATFCTGEITTTDARTAELSKLAENSFRDVNIAYANELSLVCDDLGIDVWELISLANRHPRVNILQPGPGVGGHCIAVDPWFIVSADREHTALIRTAREVNDAKPSWVIQRAEAILDSLRTDTPTVAVLGLAFKPDIDDLRESPSLAIADRLAEEFTHAKLLAVEPNITELPPVLARHDNVVLSSLEEAVAASDMVLLLVDHTPFTQMDPKLLGARPVIDTRGLWVRGRSRR